jgi:hypothetical protein
MSVSACAALAVWLSATIGQAGEPAGKEAAPAAVPEIWVTLYAGIARMNGVAISRDEVRRGLTPLPHAGSDAAFRALSAKIHAPEIDTGYVYGVDLADVDNDGQKEYVLWFISSGFLRGGEIAGVYRPRGESLAPVPVPPFPPPHTSDPAMFDDVGRPYVEGVSPFLSTDREGVTMRYVEGSNGSRQHARYLWKGGTIRLLNVAPCSVPACDTPSHY